MFVDGLNSWYMVPERSLAIIHQVLRFFGLAVLMWVKFSNNYEYFTNGSLVVLRIDDIADRSPMRREHPATHVVFGVGQTANSALWAYGKAMENLLLLSETARKDFLGEFLLSPLRILQY